MKYTPKLILHIILCFAFISLYYVIWAVLYVLPLAIAGAVCLFNRVSVGAFVGAVCIASVYTLAYHTILVRKVMAPLRCGKVADYLIGTMEKRIEEAIDKEATREVR